MTTDTKASVAAALMQAANCRHTYGLKDPDDAYGVNTVVYVSRDAILALITPDAMAALEAVKAEARKEGMREAARIADYAGAIQDQRDGSYAGSVAVMGRDVGDMIRAAMEGKQ